MDRSDEIMVLLKEIQRGLSEESQRASRRWKTAVAVVVVCVIVAIPDIFGYINSVLVRWF